MIRLISLVAGLLFGAGLAISGMTDRQKVLNFLDVFGTWDPSLMFVMGSALLLTIPGFFLAKKWSKPLFTDHFQLPSKIKIDPDLASGAVLFGVGWGLYGLCPGPAIASLVYGSIDTILFVTSMILGMALYGWISKSK